MAYKSLAPLGANVVNAMAFVSGGSIGTIVL